METAEYRTATEGVGGKEESQGRSKAAGKESFR